jgi:hypothetical protein
MRIPKLKPWQDPADYELVYTTHITLRNGRRLLASEVGKRCFVFWAKKRRKSA